MGRIDRLYDNVLLAIYLISLSGCLYLYNLADDGKWKGTFIERFEEYLPLAIQFFLGGLSSAYVIYFSRSVSLSKTAAFFIILVIVFFANELFKKRLSNKYLQFSAYFFVSFTFYSFYIPVIIKEMNTLVFILSGVVSLAITFILVLYIYFVSPSTRVEINIGKLFAIIIGIYLTLNLFYFLNLIPPVPLALERGLAAHHVEKENGDYIVTYETDEWYIFWREYRIDYSYKPGESVYIYSSIFAPTDLKKSIMHRWKWFNPDTNQWEVVEDIGFDITGGRDGGYRGYTFKNNVAEGQWRVEVITEEELVLGVIEFEIESNPFIQPRGLVTRRF